MLGQAEKPITLPKKSTSYYKYFCFISNSKGFHLISLGFQDYIL